jgi:LmbE family N-acetylglucosaminyl deacetylase
MTPHPPQVLVFVHAHPDDEALLTAGTMARAVAEGQRVVLIVATNGEAGLTSSALSAGLGLRRQAELAASADAIGVHRVVTLGYPDSGLHGEQPDGFAHLDRFTVAKEIAAVLDAEDADTLIGYDSAGGYGHPDHLQVHRATRAAAVLAKKPPQLFEATLPREPIVKAVRLAAKLHLTPSDWDAHEFDFAWTAGAEITHRVNVRPFMKAKRQALRAHASQAGADGTTRTLAVLTRIPGPLASILLGTEYYIRVSDPKAAKTRGTASGAS